jgi:hypothetical protein
MDIVFLSTKNLPLTYANEFQHPGEQGVQKTLQDKFIREFELGKRRGENALEVLLPQHWKLARMFNISEMKPSNIDNNQEQAEPPPLLLESSKVQRVASWEIEKILQCRINPATKEEEYKVK